MIPSIEVCFLVIESNTKIGDTVPLTVKSKLINFCQERNTITLTYIFVCLSAAQIYWFFCLNGPSARMSIKFKIIFKIISLTFTKRPLYPTLLKAVSRALMRETTVKLIPCCSLYQVVHSTQVTLIAQ